MADGHTTHYGWIKPEVGGSAGTWGPKENGNLDAIDAQMFSNTQVGLTPVGAIIMFPGGTPANWMTCDGRSLSTTTFAALFAVIGYTYGGSGANFNLPNFNGRFCVGANGFSGFGATGGEYTHSLIAAENAPHSHGITDPQHSHPLSSGSHTHSDLGHGHTVTRADQDPHHHTIPSSAGGGFGAAAPPRPMVANQPSTDTSDAQPALHVTIGTGFANIQASGTGVTGTNNAATGITVQSQGAGQAHNNMPPYLAVNFIIKVQ